MFIQWVDLLNRTHISKSIRKYEFVEFNRKFDVDVIKLIVFVIYRISMIELFDIILSKFDSLCFVDLNSECFTLIYISWQFYCNHCIISQIVLQYKKNKRNFRKVCFDALFLQSHRFRYIRFKYTNEHIVFAILFSV